MCDVFYETYNSPHKQQKALDANCSYSHKLALRSKMILKKKKVTLCLYTLYAKAGSCSEAQMLSLNYTPKLQY